MPIVNRIAEFEAELIEWRHQLHKFPELGFEEHQTAEFIAEKLNQMGLDVNRGSVSYTHLTLPTTLVV